MLVYPKNLYPTKKQRVFFVRIAKEIIKTILPMKDHFNIDTNMYFDTLDSKYGLEKKYKNSFKAYLKKYITTEKPIKYCTVCALGSAIISKTLIKNETKISQLSFFGACHEGTILEDLMEDIGSVNVQLVEHAFERKYIRSRNSEVSLDLDNKAILHFDEIKSPRLRLLYIMQNVIKNKGIYVPRGCKLEN